MSEAVSNNYPFPTKKSIESELKSQEASVRQAVSVLQERKLAGKGGWTASHTKKGAEFASLVTTKSLVGDQLEAARTLVLNYTKQLAVHYRQEMIAANPSLKEIAEKFSAA